MPKTSKPIKRPSARKPHEGVKVELIRAMIKAAGIPKATIARDHLRLDPAGFHLLINGFRRLQIDEVEPLARALNQRSDAILEAFGMRGTLEALKAIGGAAGGLKPAGVRAVEVSGWVDGSLVVRKEGLRGRRTVAVGETEYSKNLVALRFQTSGTELSAWDGSILFYRDAPKKDASESIGKLAIVKLADGVELRVREIRRSYELGRFDLYGIGGKAMEQDVALEATYPLVDLRFGG